MIKAAKIVISKIGGAQAVADILGCSLAKVYKRTYETGLHGGTGGFTDCREQDIIIAATQDSEYPIKRKDFFPPEDFE